ncbi:MAG: 30S ribosomal protein S6 [Kiritimatiellae bacterium]|nr:30S ribosomal protein S6 [Kiritimatiellia bacterium]
MKKYDALYIFVGIAKDDALNANLEKALAEVARVGGTILTTESLGKRAFSRPMSKKDSGVYVKVRMELDPSKVSELVDRYRLVEEVFRVQILAVDERREAKIVAERAARAERQAKKEAAAAAVAVEA